MKTNTLAVVGIALLSIVAFLAVNGGDGVSAVDADNTSNLQEMFQNGGDIRLASDVTITERLVVEAGTSVTLDLNGHTLSSDFSSERIMINVFGTLTIRDSSSNGTGTILTEDDALLVASRAGADVTLQSGNYIRSGVTNLSMLQVNGGLTIDGGTYTMTNGKSVMILVSEGSVEINDGTFSSNRNVIQMGGGSLTINYIDITNAATGLTCLGGVTTINDFDMKTSTTGINVQATSSNGVVTNPEVTINGGHLESDVYGIGIFGYGYTDESDNENAKLVINDIDLWAGSYGISTNASGGIFAGFTMDMNGGNVSAGSCGIYAPGYGIYDISGGRIEGDVAGIRIAAGILNISGDAVIYNDAEPVYESLGPGDGAGNMTGAIVAGKVNKHYVHDLIITISGGTVSNPSGNAIVACDNSLGDPSFANNKVTVAVNGGSVQGDVVLTTSTANNTNDPGTDIFDFILDGGSVNGDIQASEKYESKVTLQSGSVSGNVSGADMPSASGTVTYSWTGQSCTYFGGVFSISADVPVRQGSTLEGYRVSGSSTIYQMGDRVTASGNVTVTPVWSSNVPPIIFDDEEEEVVGGTAGSEGKDDSTTVVACAAAAVVAALMAAFLILDRRP